MAESRKRRPTQDGDLERPSQKRARTDVEEAILLNEDASLQSEGLRLPSVDELAKNGLRRSVVLALQQVGFESASPTALEGFTNIAETYLSHLIDDVKRTSNAARRNLPIGPDFEHVLARYNLATGALRPHLRPPVPRRKRRPAWLPLELHDDLGGDLPYLGPELSGQRDKKAKAHIPSTFPDFPNIHTYKYTPEVVEAVTIPDIWPDSEHQIPLQADAKGKGPATATATPTAKVARPPLKPDEIPRGDAKKLREAVAREARLGEEALRRLQRASKLAKQSELWATAERDPVRKTKMRLWQDAMRELMGEEGGGGQDVDMLDGEFGHDGVLQGRVGIADRSMVVNADVGQRQLSKA